MKSFLHKIKLNRLNDLFNRHILDPLLNFVEKYVRRLGPIFVAFLISMMFLVTLGVYLIVLPYEFTRRSLFEMAFLLILGHYLLIHTVLYYWAACKTEPGRPPVIGFVALNICKHCQKPKPVRSHHCSVCQRCILKMDHHCPWLNKCVGHYNHRLFFMSILFMWFGSLFVVLCMWQSFIDHYWSETETAAWCLQLGDTFPYSSYLCRQEKRRDALQFGQSVHNCVVFEFFSCLAMVVGLGPLLFWHAWLISTGQTSIEQPGNKGKRAKLGKSYLNPYDHGFWMNWRLFFMDSNGKFSWRRILLFSGHKPFGDGLFWNFGDILKASENNNCATRSHIV